MHVYVCRCRYVSVILCRCRSVRVCVCPELCNNEVVQRSPRWRIIRCSNSQHGCFHNHCMCTFVTTCVCSSMLLVSKTHDHKWCWTEHLFPRYPKDLELALATRRCSHIWNVYFQRNMCTIEDAGCCKMHGHKGCSPESHFHTYSNELHMSLATQLFSIS